MKKAEAQATSLNLFRVMTPADKKAAITPAQSPNARQMMQQVCLWFVCGFVGRGSCALVRLKLFWRGKGCGRITYLRRQQQVAVGVLVGPGGRGVLDLLVVAPAVAVLRPLHLAALRDARAHVEDAELRFASSLWG